METELIKLFDIFHTVNIPILNLKTFFTQSLLHLFGKRKHCVKFHVQFVNSLLVLQNCTTVRKSGNILFTH